MIEDIQNRALAAIFITFSGNCRKALSFYQTCFGGVLEFETFDTGLYNYPELVVSGSLVSDRIIIYGSDLVHNEGRKLGNYMSILLQCGNRYYRQELMKKLGFDKNRLLDGYDDQNLVEVTDAFDVRWVLGI
jgi:PhnB protein